MTTKQKALYWRQWAAVRKMLIDWGGFDAKDADVERHKIHEEALGKPKSSTAFNNRDLDAVLDHFRAYLVLPQGPATAPKRADFQPRNRLMWAIAQTGLDDAYIAAISLDQFKTEAWRDLPEAQLVNLRWTCIQRGRAKRRDAHLKSLAP